MLRLPKGYGILAVAALGFAGWSMPFFVWLLNSRGYSAGPAIPYANNGHCDVWYYFGLATFAKSASILAPESRFIARITAYLPIYWLERPLPFTAIERNFIFYHTLAYLGVLLAIKPLYGWRIAILTAVFITTSALYISVLSTTYPSGAALAFGMLALACLTNAAALPRHGILLCFAAGILLSWAMNAHLFTVMYFALLPCILLIERDWNLPRLLGFFIAALIGALVGLAATGIAALSIGQPFDLSWYQIKAALKGVGDWYRIELLKQSVATPLGLGLGVALAASIRSGDRLTAVITAIWSVTVTCVFVQTFVFKGTAIVYDQFFVLLLVPGALAIAELTRRPESARLPLVAIVAAIVGHLLLGSLLAKYVDLRTFYLKYYMILTCGFMLGLAIAAIFQQRWTVTVMLFLGLQCAIANYSQAHWIVDPVAEGEKVRTVTQILSFLDRSHLSTRPVVWISRDADAEYTLATVRSLVRCRYETTYPSLPTDLKQGSEPHRQILITITPPEVELDAIRQTIERDFHSLEDVRSEIFGSKQRRLRVTIARI